jgi:hypothetical protein
MALDGLSDVDAAAPSDGDALTWVDAHAAWEPVAGGGGTPTAITVANEGSDTTCFPAFFTDATGDLEPKTNTELTYDASTGALGATRFNGLADAQLLTTADDTTTTLDGTYASDLLITGSGVLQIYNLGTASDYAEGKRFTFRNQTNEFVGVVNGDSTVWHRVPPRGKCECVLEDNSTAAGVWWSAVDDPAASDPKYGFTYFNDFDIFINATTVNNGALGISFAGNGTGAVPSTSAITSWSIGGRRGTVALSTGTTISGWCLGYSTFTNGYLGSGCRAQEGSGSLSDISSTDDEYIARFGPGDNVTGGAHTNGCYFIYDRLNLGTNWWCKNINGAGNTLVDSGVQPVFNAGATLWQALRVEISSAAARSDFWIDRVNVSGVGGVSGNMPLTSTALKTVHWGITKTEDAGINVRRFKMDYMLEQLYPTTLR